eukprot:TRINITY_DN12207_c0_g1_i1.p1 TRINITY_DN12207_c0_g1~~TRINITY_DN12207_c0_g1_i1.p1  ORF type:complete len:292 (-),score=59.59 TRINITY_DN12207_c0_g1_i1:14-889(-)
MSIESLPLSSNFQQRDHQDHKDQHDRDPYDTPKSPVNERRAGRRKINIEFIEDKSRRHITFSKRKAGIMKKAYELSTLTGTQVLLLVASETGHVYTFATPKLQPLITKPEGKNLIQTCLNTNDSPSSSSNQQTPTPHTQGPPASNGGQLNPRVHGYEMNRGGQYSNPDSPPDDDDEHYNYPIEDKKEIKPYSNVEYGNPSPMMRHNAQYMGLPPPPNSQLSGLRYPSQTFPQYPNSPPHSQYSPPYPSSFPGGPPSNPGMGSYPWPSGGPHKSLPFQSLSNPSSLSSMKQS